MKIGIFCSANTNIDADFFKATEQFGRWIGSNGHTLVYGGCNLGLMECVGKAVRESGGRTIGMIPSLVEKHGKVSDHVEVHVACNDLSDRKELILAQSEVLVALPGGIGTLDEIFTVAASHTIGYHRKMVVLYNMKGFWNSTIALLDDMQRQGFIRGRWSDFIAVANDFEELTAMIQEQSNG